MKHLPYKNYKNSGIEWVGDIPQSWDIDRVKASIKSCKNGIWGEEPIGDENDTVCVRVADFDRDNLSIDIEDPTLRNIQNKEKVTRTLKKGDLLIEKSGGGENQPVGCVVLYNHDTPAVCSNFIARMSLKEGMSPSFWKYMHAAAYSIRLTIGSINQTSGIQNLDQDRYFNEKVPFPPLDEQQAIANFLDRETAKIDELIQKQEKLIELIQEKIASVTDSLVTKGLDKSASLKKTQFQTLGEVPSHWDVLQIKKIVSTPVTDGPHETPDFLDDGVPFVSAEAVSKGFIDFEKIRGFISPEANEIYSRKYSPQVHDIYMIKSGATTGVTAIVEDRTDFNIWSPLAVIRCSKRMNPHYVLYAMRSKYFQEMVSLSWSFGTQQNIGMGVIENLCIPVPPREEQDAIVLGINSILSGLKQLQDKATSAIPLLKEHRASLISAAVTGKIDVRELA